MKLLIANRGEIALRIVRTAHEMGMTTVAVYAEQDRHARYVQLADEAYLLPGETYNDTYLNESAIIEILRRSAADAVHPGYGFLSEVPGFAQAIEQTGAIWVGPHHRALTQLGDKISARQCAQRAQVPPVPGISEPVHDVRTLLDFAHEYGYPVMMKRTDGGGGRGITVVHDDEELHRFFTNHDALQGGDVQSYFIEKFIASARHVETQSGRDQHGNFTVYSTRDCSLQRRNQKLIEEAPAPQLPAQSEQLLIDYSRRLFETVDYVGLGTCEFMLTPDQQIYFLEVNPRLQVEHTVSEEVCGLDLVREQLNIATGLPLTQAPATRGHSFELRITSENPDTNLAPGSGRIDHITWPAGPGVRIDAGVEEGDTISPKFDSMMGKIIITAHNRPAAIARVRRALQETRIEGVPTPIKLYEQIFHNDAFTAEHNQPFAVDTTWLERNYLQHEPASSLSGQPASLMETDTQRSLNNTQNATENFLIEVDNRRVKLTLPVDIVTTLTGGVRSRSAKRLEQPLRGVGLHSAQSTRTQAQSQAKPGVIASPMQAVVTRIAVAEGQEVAKGDLIVVLESMKMENYVYAPAAGMVEQIFVSPLDGVEAGDTLLTLDVKRKEESHA